MSDRELDDIDYEAAYAGYLKRFQSRFGDRPDGAFVKFGKHMVQKLGRSEFQRRLESYVHLHHAVRHMLDAGSTISDALVLDFVEASAWIAIEAPDTYAMFRGELGDPRLAAPNRDDLRSTARLLPSVEQRPLSDRRDDSTDRDVRADRGSPGGRGD